MHKAILEMKLNLYNPRYNEILRIFGHDDSRKIVKYEGLHIRAFGVNEYENVIHEELLYQKEFVIWEGEILHQPLLEGDKLRINDVNYLINEVIKCPDGSYVYRVGEKNVKSDNYDRFLKECEEKYDKYVVEKQLSHQVHDDYTPPERPKIVIPRERTLFEKLLGW